MFVGLKKYTSDPSSIFLTLFGHHFEFISDVKGGTGQINKFDWDCLEPSIEVNVFKEKHHKNKLEDCWCVLLLLNISIFVFGSH